MAGSQKEFETMSDQPPHLSKEAGPYEETVLSSDLGTVTFRDYGNGGVWLGLREGNAPNSPPKIFIQLTERQQVTLSGLFLDARRQRRGLT